MSLEWIRQQYNVPAWKGRGIEFDGKPGRIVGANGPHLRVRIEGYRYPVTCHPTWRIKYV